VMADQDGLFGPVASVPTCWRALDEIAGGGSRALARITAAVNAARRQAWAGIVARHGAHRRRLMVTCDGAGASHGLISRLDALATRPGHQLTYSVGWDLGERERTAIRRAPQQAWQIAVDHRGEVRERRADDACTDRRCAAAAGWKKPTSPSSPGCCAAARQATSSPDGPSPCGSSPAASARIRAPS
jgi:hypothetical protein